MKRPFIILVALIVYFFIPNSLIFGISELLCFPLLLFLGLFTRKRRLSGRDIRSIYRFLFWPVLMFVIFGLCNMFSNFMNDVHLFFRGYLLIIPVKIVSFSFFGLLVMVRINDEQDLLQMLKIFCIVGFFAAAVIGIAQYITGKRFLFSPIYSAFYQDNPFSRLTTFKLDDPNWAILDLLPITLLTMFLACSRFNRQKIWWVMFPISFLALVLTFSRTGWVVFAVLAAWFILKSKTFDRKILIGIGVVLCLIVTSVVVVLAAKSAGWQHRLNESDRLMSAYNLNLRYRLWSAALDQLYREPQRIFFGFTAMSTPRMLWERIGLGITLHSFYLTVLYKYGLVGLTFALMFLASVLRTFMTALSLSKGSEVFHDMILVCMLGFIGYVLLIGLISDMFDFYLFFFWALSVKLEHISRNRMMHEKTCLAVAT